MNKWKPVDIAVFIIVCTLGIGLVTASITPIITGVPISDKRSEIIAGIISGLIAIVSMYVGARVQRHKDDQDQNKTKKDD